MEIIHGGCHGIRATTPPSCFPVFRLSVASAPPSYFSFLHNKTSGKIPWILSALLLGSVNTVDELVMLGEHSVLECSCSFEMVLPRDLAGESDEERDKMLLQLEQECLDVYKRKVDQAVKQMLVSFKSMSVHCGRDKFNVVDCPIIIHIHNLPSKISGNPLISTQMAGIIDVLEIPVVDESDLSLKRLVELHAQLQEREKNDRLQGQRHRET